MAEPKRVFQLVASVRAAFVAGFRPQSGDACALTWTECITALTAARWQLLPETIRNPTLFGPGGARQPPPA
jgi:hypothetical protein